MDTAETRTVSEVSSAHSETRILERGTIVHRYVILDKLGEGGMGVVYTAYDPDLDRQIALKILRSRTDKRGVSTKRLKREAQALAQLSHPNVINVHDVGIYHGDVFLAMEFVRGPNLRVWLRNHKPPLSHIIQTFVQAGRGLAAAHKAGLIHRDFKPDNVIVGDDGRVRVLDFGLARADDRHTTTDEDITTASGLDWFNEKTPVPILPGTAIDSAPIHSQQADADDGSMPTPNRRSSSSLLHIELTEAHGLRGTPAYMSPEQFCDEIVDSRSDQYSYCTALFEALCKFRPVKAEALDSLRRRVSTGRLEPIPPERHVPRHIQYVLRRGLALEPTDRFLDMDSLLRELERNPASRVRTIALVAVTAVIVALVAFAFARGQEPPASPCVRAADRLHEVWNDSSRSRLQRAFLASERAHSRDSYERTYAVLASYADAWADMRVATCEATRVRGEQSGRLLDLRMYCLDRRLAQMDALLHILSDEPTAEVIDTAITAAYRLPSLAECSDSEVLMSRTPLPNDMESRRRISELAQELDRAEALRAAGRYRQGLLVARGAVDRARVLDYPPVLTEALYLAGYLAEQTSDSKTAEETLLAAVTLAAQVGDLALSAEIWTELVWTVGHSRARFDEAVWLGHMAQTTIVQSGAPRLLEARLASHQGSVAFAAGKTEESYLKHEAALTIRRDELGAAHPDVAESLSHLGANLYRQGRYADAAEYHEQALATRIEALGASHPVVGHSYLNLGLALVPQGQYDKAHEQYVRALAIYEASYGSAHAYVGISHNNLGEYWWLQGQPERSRRHYATSLQIFEKAHGKEHPYTAYALTGLGQALVGLAEFTAARALLERAHAIREQSGATAAERAVTDFYLMRARWHASERQPDVLVRARAAYEAYAAEPFHLDAESQLMRAWLTTTEAHGHL